MKHRILIVLILSTLLGGCVGTATLISCAVDSPAEPEPAHELGEFDFELSYEIDGNNVVVKDTIICKYEGRACDGRGLHNQWGKSFASGRDMVVLRQLSGHELIYYPLGSCKRLMDGELPKYNSGAAIERKIGTTTGWSHLRAAELRKYNIKISKLYAKQKP